MRLLVPKNFTANETHFTKFGYFLFFFKNNLTIFQVV